MPPPDRSNPKVFGKYEVIRRLAVGGMGEIFLARQGGVAGFDRLAILKSLLPQLASEEDMLASFLDEARIIGSINHPNVVACFEVGEWEGVYFMAMEFINGVDVAALQKAADDAGERFPIHVAMAITREAALGLDSAHHATDAQGRTLHIVHRDISPHNVMVRSDGLTKVVDFGVALAANRGRRTEVGMLKGKLGYMAPEQIRGHTAESFADQFSLGVMFWELLTGRRLFTAEEAHTIFMKIVKDPVPPPSSVKPDVPPEVDAIALRMLAQEPAHRFPRLADAAAAIRKVLDQRGALESESSDFVKRLVGAQLAERVADLTPGAVSILGVRTREPAAGGSSAGFCSACGAKAVEGDRFCRSCGSQLGGGPAAASSAPSPSPLPAPVRSAAGSGRPQAAVASEPDPAMDDIDVSMDDVDSNAPVERGVCACSITTVGEDDPEIVSNLVRPLVEQFEKLAARAHGAATVNGNGLVVTFRGDNRAARAAISFARSAWAAAAQFSTPVAFRAVVSARSKVESTDATARNEAEGLLPDIAAGAILVVDEARRLAQVGHRWRSPAARKDGKKTTAVAAHEVAPPPVVAGRAAERTGIEQALGAALHGKAQQQLLLGEAGSGKSTLLALASSEAHDRGFVVAHARCGWHRHPLRYDAIRQAVRSACLDLLRVQGSQGEWHTALDALQLVPQERRRLVALVGNELDAGDTELQPAHRRLAWRGAVLTFFARVAERRGVCIVIDDAHRADPSSLEVLGEIGSRLHKSKVVVIAAGRLQGSERLLPYARRVTLEPMSAAEVTQVASVVTRAEVPPPVGELLAARAKGNPLFVALLTRYLISAGLLVVKNRSGAARALVFASRECDRFPMPESLPVLLFALHATTPPDIRKLLEHASLLGQVFMADELDVVAGADQSLVLEEAVALRVLESDGEGRYAFGSLIEQQIVADRVTSDVAGPKLAALAAVIEQRHPGVEDPETRILRRPAQIEERLVQLALAARDRERAARAAERAALAWTRLGAVEAALPHYRRALQDRWIRLEGDRSEPQLEAALKLAVRASAALIDVDAPFAAELALPILKLVPEGSQEGMRCEALRTRSLALLKARRAEDAQRVLAELLNSLPEFVTPTLRGALLLDEAMALESTSRNEVVRERLQEAARLLTGAPRGGEALLALGRVQLRMKDTAAARESFTQAREDGRKRDSATMQVEALLMLTTLAQTEKQPERALALLDEAVALATRVGDGVFEARVRQQMARTRQQMGQNIEALAAARLALSLAQRLGWDEGVSASTQIVNALERR